MITLPNEYMRFHLAKEDASKVIRGAGAFMHLGTYGTPGTSYGAFKCCGSQTLHTLGSMFADEHERQELTALFLRTKGDYLSWYFIASTSQVNNYNTPMHVLGWLRELGAEEIDRRPNKYHAPNDMHLFVLTLEDNKNLEKFVTLNPASVVGSRDAYGHTLPRYEPNWWAGMKEADQKEWMNKQKPIVEARIAAEKTRSENFQDTKATQEMWNLMWGLHDNPKRLEAAFTLAQSYGESRLLQNIGKQFVQFAIKVEAAYNGPPKTPSKKEKNGAL